MLSEFDICPRKLMCNFIEAEKESQCVSVCVPEEKLAPAAAQAIAAMSGTFVQENSMPPESLHIPANVRALAAEIVEAATMGSEIPGITAQTARRWVGLPIKWHYL